MKVCYALFQGTHWDGLKHCEMILWLGTAAVKRQEIIPKKSWIFNSKGFYKHLSAMSSKEWANFSFNVCLYFTFKIKKVKKCSVSCGLFYLFNFKAHCCLNHLFTNTPSVGSIRHTSVVLMYEFNWVFR